MAWTVLESHAVRLAWLVVAALMATPAWAQPSADVQIPDVLTLDRALELFRQHGYTVLLADAAVAAASGDVRASGAVPNPAWFLQGSYSFAFPGGVKPDPAWGVTASLGDNNAIEDSLSGKRGLRLKVAQAALAAARLQRNDAQRALEFQVKAQYTNALLARDLLDFAIEIQKSAQQTYDLVHLRYQSGAISEADEAKVETMKLEAEQTVDQSTTALRVAKIGLVFLLGLRGAVPEFHVAQDLPAFVVPPELARSTKQQLLDEALQRRPDLAAARKQRERAEAHLSLARRLRFPDLNLNLSYQQQAGTDKNAAQPPTFAVGLGGTLPVFYFQQGEIDRAAAELRSQTIDNDRVIAQITNEIETAWAHFTTSKQLVERMQARLLDRAKRTRDLVEIQYKKGAASLLEFLDAQRTWIATNEEYYQDLANYWTAVYELEMAIGRELR